MVNGHFVETYRPDRHATHRLLHTSTKVVDKLINGYWRMLACFLAEVHRVRRWHYTVTKCCRTWHGTACDSVVRIGKQRLCCTADIVDQSLAWLKLRDGLHVALQRQWSSRLTNSWGQCRRPSSMYLCRLSEPLVHLA